ncbi:HAD-IA family hydrolase [Brucella pituitosa]|uniref:HAD-IA family hydrolase n=1 Tax=Brucella pituitosa TaxID=571256 RepID=UPI0020052D9B|nr:HAD-IA family hydrolase [Brucella pituitosa]MCK4207138.1 HAD-IA family hydrolase [Brucella pituitosa]
MQFPRAVVAPEEPNAGLLGRIDAVVGVDMVERGKPAPDVYLAAVGRLGLQPSECVALDDSDLAYVLPSTLA